MRLRKDGRAGTEMIVGARRRGESNDLLDDAGALVEEFLPGATAYFFGSFRDAPHGGSDGGQWWEWLVN